eukprot:Nitzschia sp. Nitz4//scaffold96_size78090//9547//11821//NITZ4_005484-RA/size78090-augustus-gene-0.11-mRNA-1//-1//CDS//3329560543//9296//frame0
MEDMSVPKRQPVDITALVISSVSSFWAIALLVLGSISQSQGFLPIAFGISGQRRSSPSWFGPSECNRPSIEKKGTAFLPPLLFASNNGVSNVTYASEKDEWKAIVAALTLYSDSYGDLLVPPKFVIPSMMPWPEHTWGLHLGKVVQHMRDTSAHVGRDKKRRETLNRLGFVWKLGEEKKNYTKAQPPRRRRVKRVPKIYPLLIPPTPKDQDEREAIEKLALEIGILRKTPEGVTKIGWENITDTGWMIDDYGDEFVFGDVVEGLTLYKQFYGDFPRVDFVVPSPEEELYPDHPRYDHWRKSKFIAEVPPYDWTKNVSKFASSDELIAAKELAESLPPLRMYEPTPITEVDWPEYLAGLKLGYIVERIRVGALEVKHDRRRKKALDDIGFDWGDPERFIDVPFEKFLCAFYAFFRIKGHACVPFDFEIPDDDPWPKILAGYKLGEALQRVWDLKPMLKKYHPERYQLLSDMDFPWVPDALPENTAELWLQAAGHPDYFMLTSNTEIPSPVLNITEMSMITESLFDGPNPAPEDPRQWWRKWHSWDHVERVWYGRGRRDNAFVLRRLGFPELADEHEHKYGPGLFSQMNDTFATLQKRSKLSRQERDDYLEAMDFYRVELDGCTDLSEEELESLLGELDLHSFRLATGQPMATKEDLIAAANEYKYKEQRDYEMGRLFNRTAWKAHMTSYDSTDSADSTGEGYNGTYPMAPDI